MKSLPLYLIFLLVTASCSNQNDKQKNKPITLAPGQKLLLRESIGSNSIPINTEIALEMIARYDSIFIQNGTPQQKRYLGRSVWIDDFVIRSLAKKLEGANGYEGVRFYNIAASNTSETNIIMSLTKLNNLVPAPKSKHQTDWNGNFTLDELRTPEFKNFNKSLNQAKPLTEKFESLFRGTQPGTEPQLNKNRLSSSVWISETVIIYLRDLLSVESFHLDGIRIYFAAYDGFEEGSLERGQFDKNQSTIILVPTSKDDVNGHLDRWDVIPDNTQFITGTKGGLNHGELCPQICN